MNRHQVSVNAERASNEEATSAMGRDDTNEDTNEAAVLPEEATIETADGGSEQEIIDNQTEVAKPAAANPLIVADAAVAGSDTSLPDPSTSSLALDTNTPHTFCILVQIQEPRNTGSEHTILDFLLTIEHMQEFNIFFDEFLERCVREHWLIDDKRQQVHSLLLIAPEHARKVKYGDNLTWRGWLEKAYEIFNTGLSESDGPGFTVLIDLDP